MGSIFSREGSKDNRCRGRRGGEEKEEEKGVLCFAYEPPRLNQDFVFAAYGTKDDNRENKGTMIFISMFIFVLVGEVIPRVLELKRAKNEWIWEEDELKKEENGNGKEATFNPSSSSSSSSYSSLCDDLQLLIMSKVPVRSLVKFRCVSKTWHSWIYKEHFFLGKCPSRTDGIFFRVPNGLTYIPLHSDNYDEEDDEDSYTIFVPPTTCTLPFPSIDDGNGGSLRFTLCCHASNGLLLLSTPTGLIADLLVHNPLTRQSLLLPVMASQKFIGPLWIGYEPRVSPYFNVVHAFFMSGATSLLLQIFSSRSWAWHDLIIDVRLVITRKRGSGKAVTCDSRMFIDLTFFCSIVLMVDLHNGKDYVIVPLPPGLPPCLEDAWSALGMCQGNIMYAYSQGGVLLVYKLFRLEQGDYGWSLLIAEDSLQDRIAIKTGMAPTCLVEAQDFLLHVPVLIISVYCSVTRRCKLFSYNFTNGSILEVFESQSRIFTITSLSVCPLEIYSGYSSRVATAAGKKK